MTALSNFSKIGEIPGSGRFVENPYQRSRWGSRAHYGYFADGCRVMNATPVLDGLVEESHTAFRRNRRPGKSPMLAM